MPKCLVKMVYINTCCSSKSQTRTLILSLIRVIIFFYFHRYSHAKLKTLTGPQIGFLCKVYAKVSYCIYPTVFDLITAHAPINAQSSNLVVFT